MERSKSFQKQGIRTKNVRFPKKQSTLQRLKSAAKKTAYGVGGIAGGSIIVGLFSESFKEFVSQLIGKWAGPAMCAFGISLLITEQITSRKRFKFRNNKYYRNDILYYFLLMINTLVFWNYTLVFNNLTDIISFEANQILLQGTNLYEDVGKLFLQKTNSIIPYLKDKYSSPWGIINLATNASRNAYSLLQDGIQHSIAIGMTTGIASVTKTYNGFLSLLDGMIYNLQNSERVEQNVIGKLLRVLKNSLDVNTYNNLKQMGQKIGKENTQDFVQEVYKLMTVPEKIFDFKSKITSAPIKALSEIETIPTPIDKTFKYLIQSSLENLGYGLQQIGRGAKAFILFILSWGQYGFEIINRALEIPYIYTEKIDVAEKTAYVTEPLKTAINGMLANMEEADKKALMKELGQPLLFDDKKGFLGNIYDAVDRNVYETINNIENNRELYRNHMVNWESLGLLTASKLYIIGIIILFICSFGMEGEKEEESRVQEYEEEQGGEEQGDEEPQPPIQEPQLFPQQIPAYNRPVSPKGTKKKQTQKYIELPSIQEYAQPYTYEEVGKEESEESKLDKMINLLGSLQESISRRKQPKKKEESSYKEKIHFEELPKKLQQLVEPPVAVPVAGGFPEGAFETITKKRSSPQKRITQYFGKSKQQ